MAAALFLGAAAVVASAASAPPRHTGQPLIRYFSERDTGGAARSHAVAVHRSGLVYLANDAGLREFDGVGWQLVRGTEGLAVFSVATNEAGQVFFGGPNHFGLLAPAADGALAAVPLAARLPDGERDIGEIWEIKTTRDGAYFLSESRGLLLHVDGAGAVRTIPLRERNFALTAWQGRIYAGNGQKLYRLDGATAVLEPENSPLPCALLGRQQCAAWPRPEGGAWIVARGGGLRLWQADAAPLVADDVRKLLGSDTVACAEPLEDGTFAFGTRAHGLLIVGADGRLRARYHDETTPAFGFIEGLARDDSGLWVAYEGGVARLPLPSAVALHGTDIGLRGGVVQALAMHRGRLHVGASQGLFARDNTTGRFTRVGDVRQNITALVSTDAGLLAGGAGLVLVRDDATAEPVDEQRVSVRSLLRLPGQPERVVAGTSLGLRVLRRAEATWTFEGALPAARDALAQLTLDDAGWLWGVRDARQIVRVDWRRGVRFDAAVEVLGPAHGLPDFAAMRMGVRLVPLGGTVTAAALGLLLRHDTASDRFVPETRIAGLTAETATPGLFALGDGTLWFTRTTFPRCAGVVRPTGAATWAFEREPFTGVEALGALAVCADPENRTVWLGNQQLASFDLGVPRRAVPPPVARVRRVVDPEQGIVWSDAAPPSELTLPPASNALTFTVAAPLTVGTTSGPASIEYRTQLDGFDAAWSAWGKGTTRVYTNLPPGRFAFRAQARGEDNVEGPVATVAFRLLAPWWRTWWFIGCAGVTVVGVVAAATRGIATRALRRRLQLLEAQSAVERERLRLARDLHDEVGSGLGRVILFAGEADRALGDPAKQREALARVRGAAQDLVQHAREIVWAVSPQHDSLASVIERLGDYAEETLRSAGIACTMERPPAENIPPATLGSEARHSLFLAVKEAVHNCVKYSEAKSAEFSLEIVGDDFVITLRDHGRGFAPGEKRGSGHGTLNIVARAEALGGRAEITSDVGKGTTVMLRVPLLKGGAA